MTFKKILLGASCATIASLAAMPAYAQDSGVSISTSFDVVSEYVFRGASLADTAIQPGVELGLGGFYTGAWFSTGVGETSALAADELDIYAGYSTDLSDTVGVDVGVTYYHYPQSGGLFSDSNGAGTYEVFAGLSFDAPLAPSVYIYHDLTLEATTYEASVGHSFGFDDADQTFDVGLTGGFVDGDGFSYEWATASAAINVPLSDEISTYVGANFTLNSDDVLNYSEVLIGEGKDNLFWVGAGISAGF